MGASETSIIHIYKNGRAEYGNYEGSILSYRTVINCKNGILQFSKMNRSLGCLNTLLDLTSPSIKHQQNFAKKLHAYNNLCHFSVILFANCLQIKKALIKINL